MQTRLVSWPGEAERVGNGEIIVHPLLDCQGTDKTVAPKELSHPSPSPAVYDQSKAHAATGRSANRSIKNWAASPP